MTTFRQATLWTLSAAVLAGCAVSSEPAPLTQDSRGDPAPKPPGPVSLSDQLREMLNSEIGPSRPISKPGASGSPIVLGHATSGNSGDPEVPATPAPPVIDLALSAKPTLPPPVAEPSIESVQEKRSRLAAELLLTLRSSGAPGNDPLREAVPLLALYMVEPGIAAPELGAFEKTLSPAEARAFTAMREAFTELADTRERDGPPAHALDLTEVARIFREHAATLDSSQTLSIPTMALCTSVKSFGRYTPFETRTFTQGRAHQAILYVAVDHFSQHELSSADPLVRAAPKPGPSPRGTLHASKATSAIRGLRAALAAAFESKPAPLPADQDDATDYVLELEQTVELFHDSDNLVVWRVPAKLSHDVSHQRLRDCYLAQIIELPANLSTGKFNLKVTVRDIQTGALAESVLPVEVVADSPYAQANP